MSVTPMNLIFTLSGSAARLNVAVVAPPSQSRACRLALDRDDSQLARQPGPVEAPKVPLSLKPTCFGLSHLDLPPPSGFASTPATGATSGAAAARVAMKTRFRIIRLTFVYRRASAIRPIQGYACTMNTADLHE